MAVHRFTDRWIQTLSPTRNDSRMDYADKLCPCLHLRVTARGTKTFSAMPRVDGRLQRRTIGQYPIISLASARAATLEMLRKVAEGNDPRQQSGSFDQKHTYAELVEAYTELHLKPNTRSWRNVLGNLRHPGLRHLRTRRASGITKRDVVAALDAVVAIGKASVAANLLRSLKMLFNWGIDRDMLSVNVCDRIRPPVKPRERDRVLTDAEIAAVWKAAFAMPAPYGQMYRMFLLTGQRRSEVATMRWNEIAGDVWTIPREKVKKDRAHAVPLTATADATLAALPRFGEEAHVFTTTAGLKASGNFSKIKKDMDALSGVTGWTIHDIRRTVRSKLAELGVPREVARKVLNHEDGKVDRIYNRHEYLAEKREALERWEKMLMTLTETPTAESSRVT